MKDDEKVPQGRLTEKWIRKSIVKLWEKINAPLYIFVTINDRGVVIFLTERSLLETYKWTVI